MAPAAPAFMFTGGKTCAGGGSRRATAPPQTQCLTSDKMACCRNLFFSRGGKCSRDGVFGWLEVRFGELSI